MSTPWQVRALVQQRIEGLAPDAGYQHASTDAWRLSLSPMIDGAEPNQRSHLAFWVDDGRVENAGARGNAAEGSVVAAPLDIVFTFRVRPRNEAADWDASAKAAAAVLKHLVDWEPTLEPGTPPDVTIEPAAGLIDRVPLGMEWLRVSIELTAIYTLSLNE